MKPVVLLIDTDPCVLHATADLLEDQGFDVRPADSFQRVYEVISEESPRVIVIEPVLDGIDGFELCRAILNVYPDYRPTVLMASTRVRGEAQRVKARSVGAARFLARPLMNELMVQSIADAMAIATSDQPPPIDDAPEAEAIRNALAAAGHTDKAARAGGRSAARMLAWIAAAIALSLGALFIVNTQLRASGAEQTDASPIRAMSMQEIEPSRPDVIGRPPEVASIEPTRPRRVQPVEVIAPRLIPSSRSSPRYPPLARSMRVGGKVVLRAIVKPDGDVGRVEVLSEPAPRYKLGEAAAATVLHWKYEPGRRAGEAVEMPVTVKIEFVPN